MKKIFSGLIIGCFGLVFGYEVIQNNKIETYHVNADIKTRVATEYDMNWDAEYCHPLSEPVGENPKPLGEYTPTIVYKLNGEIVGICDDQNERLKMHVGCDVDSWYYDEALTNKVTGTTVGEVAYPLYIERVPGNEQCVTEFDYVTFLYAKCKEPAVTPTCPESIDKTYTLTYYVDETGRTTTQTVEVGVNKNLITPVREGYEFLGWYTDAALTNKFTGTTNNLSPAAKYDENNCLIGYGNVVLYGAWNKTAIVCPENIDKTYTLIYNENYNDIVTTETVEVGVESNIKTPTREGYEFLGWYTDAALTRKYTKTTTSNLNPAAKYDENNCLIGYGNVTLYAAWKKNDVTCDPIEMKVTINYETNGGNQIGKTIVTLGEESYSGIEIPVKENHKFEGWYYDKELTKPVINDNLGDLEYTYIKNSDECITGYNDITLYAKWSKIISNPDTGDNIIIYCAFGILLIACGVVVTKKIIKK